MGITFASLNAALPYVISIHKPIMLRGRHGIGKSCVVYQLGKLIGKRVTERRVSQMTEGDTIGLPRISDKGTEWILPDFIQDAIENPVILFFDELDRGTTEVRQAIFELCDSHKIAGHSLHPDTILFAAVNGGESGSQYQVGELDPAELDRWTVFDCEPTIEDWLTWAKDIVHPIVWDFINQNHNHLEHKGDFEPNKVYPSRRSWHRFSDCLNAGAKEMLVEGQVNSTIANLAIAFVGLEASVCFCDFVKNYSFVVTPEDILDKGKFELVKDFQATDHLALVEKFNSIFTKDTFLGIPELRKNANAAKKEEHEKSKTNRVNNLAKYFVLVPSEISMKIVDVVAHCGAQAIIALHKAPGVQEHFCKILTAEGAEKMFEKKEK